MSDSKAMAWWLREKEAEAVEPFKQWANHCIKRHESHHNRWLENLKLVYGRGLNTLNPSSYTNSMRDLTETRASKNLARSVVAAMLSQTLRNKPRVGYYSRMGDPLVQEKARLLEKFVDGIMTSNLVIERKYALSILDALCCAFGAMRTYWVAPSEKSKRADIIIKRVLPQTICYNPDECQDGDVPQVLGHARLVSRHELIAAHPKHKTHINQLQAESSPIDGEATRYEATSHEPITDRVRLREAWKLPSSPNADDGRYIMAVDGLVLRHEPYAHPRYPISFLEWFPAPLGSYAESIALVDEIFENHNYVNDLQVYIMEQFRSAQSFIANPQDSGIDNASLEDGGRRKILSITDPQSAPYIVNGQPLDPMFLSHQRTEIEDALRFSGISEMHMQGPAPKTHISNKALQSQVFEAEARFKAWAKANARFVRDIATSVVTQATEASKAGYDVESFLEEYDEHHVLKWSELKLEDSQFVIRAETMSSVPTDFAGQLDAAQQLANSGFLPKEDAFALLTDIPDLGDKQRTILSLRRAVEFDVQAILEEGEQRLPDTVDDVVYAEYYSRAVLVRVRRTLMKEKDGKQKHDLLMQYYQQAKALKDQQMQQQMAMQAPPQGAPPPQ